MRVGFMPPCADEKEGGALAVAVCGFAPLGVVQSLQQINSRREENLRLNSQIELHCAEVTQN